MNPKYYGLIEMAMTFLVVGGFIAQQFWSLRDRKPKDTDAPPAPSQPAAEGDDPGIVG